MSERPPLFSIVLPTFNRADLLPRAVMSVLGQTFVDWELLIIDDGSSDATETVAGSFHDERIKYHRQSHGERSSARNTGVQLATGRYVCFLDDDDYFLPFHLRGFFAVLEAEAFPIKLFFSDYVEDCNGILRQVPLSPRPARNGVEFMLLNLVNVPRVCVAREIFEVCAFNPLIRIGEDRDFLAQVASRFPIGHVPQCSQVLVIHPERSVAIDNYGIYRENLRTCQHLVRSYKTFLSHRARRRIISQSYYNMLLHHLLKGNGVKALYWFLRVCACDRGWLKRSDVQRLLQAGPLSWR